jgi:hypothetical protein
LYLRDKKIVWKITTILSILYLLTRINIFSVQVKSGGISILITTSVVKKKIIQKQVTIMRVILKATLLALASIS